MDDMRAIEQRISRELARRAGPNRPVDDFAIYQAVAARARSPRRGVTRFSALEFVAAGVIVALFGGLLLTGVFSTRQRDELPPAAVPESPSPVPTEASPSGMVTEEVGPGVVRVLEDGAGRTFPMMGVDRALDIDLARVGNDGSVWLVVSPSRSDNGLPDLPDCALVQVGAPGVHEASATGFPCGTGVTFAPDGTLWANGYTHFASFDGRSWTTYDPVASQGTGGTGMVGYWVHAFPDGQVWVTWTNGIGRLGSEGFEYETRESGVHGWPPGSLVMVDGTVYAVDEDRVGQGGRLVRFDGSAWSTVPVPGGDGDAEPLATSLRGGPDDTLWVHLLVDGLDAFARYDGETWDLLTAADGVPWVGGEVYGYAMEPWEVHPDGSIWVLSGERLWSFDGDERTIRWEDTRWFRIGPDGTVWLVDTDGVPMSFNGVQWRAYPDAPSVDSWGDFAAGPDGVAWIAGGNDDSDHDPGLYVLTTWPFARDPG